jgi:hypothetical protein
MASFITIGIGDEQVHVNLAYVVAVRVRPKQRQATIHVAHMEPLTIEGRQFDRLVAELEHTAHLDLHTTDDAEM